MNRTMHTSPVDAPAHTRVVVDRVWSAPLRAARTVQSTRRERRGSVLVLAIGVLALLAILVVVYATIGRTDSREGATTAASASTGDAVNEIGGYLAGVVANNTLSVQRQRDILGNDHILRATWTYPSVDPEARSLPGFPVAGGTNDRPADQDAQTNARRFNVTGSVDSSWPRTAGTTEPDPRIATAPWLSFARPTFLNWAGVDPTTATSPGWVSGGATILPEVRTYVLNRDWLSISNFSPNGLFVNKAAMRGNFGVASGVGFDTRTVNGSPVNWPRSSQLLTLLRDDATSFDPAWTGTNGTTPSIRDDGPNAHLNRPYDWTQRQRSMALPSSFAFTGGGNAAVPFGDPKHPSNQYADADGDGILDSRWFIPEDLWFDRPSSGSVDTTNPFRARNLVTSAGGMRFVVAAKAEDLSGKVNVSTAMDFRRPPTIEHPAGASPSDIDLRRFLMQRDYSLDNFIPSQVYAQPTDTSSPAYYGGLTLADAHNAGDAGYHAHTLIRSQGEFNRASELRFAPNAQLPDTLRQVIPTRNDLLDSGRGVNPILREQLYRAGAGDASRGTTLASVDNAASTRTLRRSTPYAMSDQLELLHFGGLNDSSVTSRLEAAIDGRSDQGAASNVGPLRSNRPLEVERDQTNFALQIVRAATDVRRGLSVAGGARPLRSTSLAIVSPSATGEFTPPPLSDAEVKPDINALLNDAMAPMAVDALPADAQRSQAAMQRIFQGYAAALLPFSDLSDPANPAQLPRAGVDPTRRGLRPLYYGGARVSANGSAGATQNSAFESAIRTAAHMTVNLVATHARARGSTDGTVLVPGLRDEIIAAVLKLDSSTVYRDQIYPGPSGAPLAARDRNSDGVDDFAFRYPVDLTSGSLRGKDAWPVREGDVRRKQPALTAEFNLDAGVPDSGPLARKRLADEATPLTSRTLTVFGVRPQPVIAEVAVFTMYTDADVRQGGDAEFRPTGGGGGGQPFPGGGGPSSEPRDPITINGTASTANRDFLMEVAIVQLTNPFDVSIALSGRFDDTAAQVQDRGRDLPEGAPVPDQEFKYYIEFANRFYALVDAGESDSTTTRTALVLNPGQTRSFVLSPIGFNRIQSRWRAIDSAVPDWTDNSGGGPVVENVVSAWMRIQGSVTGFRPTRLLRINPYTGERDTTNTADVGVLSPQSSGASTDADSNRVVRLWRRVDAAGERRQSGTRTETFPNPATGEFFEPRSDYLVDRMRDPGDANGRPTWNTRIPSRNNEVLGTIAGPDATQGGSPSSTNPQWWRDNSGFSIVIGASVRRPNLPEDGGGNPSTLPTGAIPPWALEVKSSIEPSSADRKVASLNKGDTVPSTFTGRELRKGMFVTGGTSPTNAALRFKGDDSLWRRMTVGASARPLFNTLTQQAKDKRGNAIPRSYLTVNDQGASVTPTRTGPSWQDLWVQLAFADPWGVRLNNAGTANQSVTILDPAPLRPGDLLTPLGVGPSLDPYIEVSNVTGLNASRNPRHLDVRWTTLGESVALALNYDFVSYPTNVQGVGNFAALSEQDPAEHPYFLAGESGVDDAKTPGQDGRVLPKFSLLDRGRLHLARFVPFLDLNNSGSFEQGGVGSVDPQFGLGVPFAAQVLEQFRFLPNGSAQASTEGLININTAPTDVLRTVPMLAPDPLGWLSQNADSTFEVGLARGVLYRPGSETWDLAAALTAYRDSSILQTRPVRNSNALTIDMRNPTNATAWDARSRRAWTRIPGLRESPGFNSLGELLSVRRDPLGTARGNLTGPTATTQIAADVSIDRLGRREDADPANVIVNPVMRAQDIPPIPLLSPTVTKPTEDPAGVTTRWRSTAPPTASAPEQRELYTLANGFDNKMAIANAVLNTVSVRSDLFAVWFVVEGYLPGDVEGLDVLGRQSGPAAGDPKVTAPMVPTLSKRFVMVVDRSNVLRVGDKPRILLMEEVPR
jgi:hypothetical protein